MKFKQAVNIPEYILDMGKTNLPPCGYEDREEWHEVTEKLGGEDIVKYNLGAFEYRMQFWKERSKHDEDMLPFDAWDLICLYAEDSKCHYPHCRVMLEIDNVTFDHLTPLSRGGRNTLDNLVVCCYDCNVMIGWSTKMEFIEHRMNKTLDKSGNMSWGG